MASLPSSVVAIRKATSLALHVPGVDLLVYQHDWPPLFVSTSSAGPPRGETWMRMTPAELRDELCRDRREASRRVGPSLGVTDTDVRIDVTPHAGTDIDAAGVFTAHLDGGGTIGFVTSSAIACAVDGPPIPHALPCGRTTELPPPTDVRLDADLGTQLVHWSFRRDDPRGAERARVAAFETLLTTAVDEIVRFAGEG
ncbi:MAG: hypothetical protein AAF548_02985 [Actinomycetota bacterium]